MQPLTASDARLETLERTVRALEARVSALETGSDLDSSHRSLPKDPDANNQDLTPPADVATWFALTGRTLVVLGGAYFLRALTENGLWTPATGVAAAFGYAAVWLVVADRTARGRPSAPSGRIDRRVEGATFHGAAAVMIALPLLWESVTRFHVVGAALAGGVLTVATLAVLAVAVRARLHALAWIALCAAVPASIALTSATGAIVPFAAADIVLGITTLWIGYTVDWVWLRWPAAAVANLTVAALTASVASHTAASPLPRIVALQLLLVGGYLASVAVRTLVRGREVIAFEALQTTAALAVGFGGAVYVTQAAGTGHALLIATALVCGAGSYAVAFAFVMRRGVQRNFLFYTSVALVLVLAGSALGLPEPAIWWSVLAVACAWTAPRAGGLTLTTHAAVYLGTAALASGLFAAAASALTGGTSSQPLLSPPLLAVFAAGCLCWAAAPPRGVDIRRAGIPRTAIALVVTLAADAWIVSVVLSDRTAPGVAAAVRTSVLAGTAVVLAWVGARTRLREAAWLVYPTLAAGAVKLAAEDFQKSGAAALFVALAGYGAAMIAAPRLLRAQAGSVPSTRRTN
jgi:hypothetical protein